MRVLTFTTLFPNRSHPNHGLFVRARMRAVAEFCDVRVVAPVPWAPPLPGARFRSLRRVPAADDSFGLPARHPRFPSLPGEWSRLKPALIARASLGTVRALHAEAPFDLVDAHFAHPDSAAAVRIAERLRLPCVVSLRGSDIHRDLGRPALRPLILDTLARAAAVIAVAEPLAEEIRAAGVPAGKIHVIDNGVDQDLFRPVDRADARRRLGLPPEPPHLVAVGKLVPVKGFDLLLDAFSRIGGEARLCIVGDGPLRAELGEQASRLGVAGRVRFAGAVPHAALPDWYGAADGFVLSSRNEGCPNVLLEALASGCPAAAAAVGQVPLILREGENGTLSAPSDAAALAEALRRLLGTRFDRDRVRRSVNDRTWPGVARRVVHVFETVIGAATRPEPARSAACSG
jgi:glycosyltransferase involved in cell wall biosynthesis